jgi:hypothetical protein
MAKIYNSIIDQILDDSINWDEAKLEDAKDSGDDLLNITHKMVDSDFVSDVKGTKKHTEVKGKDRLASQLQDKEEAGPSIIASNGDWRNRSAKALTDEGVLSDTLMELEKAKGADSEQISKREVTEAEIKSYIKKLLNDGIAPSKVAAKLDKLAEIMLFDRQMSTDYLNRNSGLLGMAYIEPNSFMDKCPDTYERYKTKLGGVRAKSVKQISACVNCKFFSKDASSKTCNLYHLPIVSSEKELLPIINKITAGVPKTSKKAALVKIANRDTDRATSHKPVEATQHTMRAATSDERIAQVVASQEFTPKEVETLHTSGKTLESIYRFGSKKVGSVQAGYAVKAFVTNLKNTNTKIALSQIDCTFLKNKLGVQNAIIGAAKCVSCTYRSGMHCGLTGGTLLSFPGMDTQASNHKIAADAPKDGHGLLKDFDLQVKKANTDIEIQEPERLDIEISNKPTLNF